MHGFPAGKGCRQALNDKKVGKGVERGLQQGKDGVGGAGRVLRVT